MCKRFPLWSIAPVLNNAALGAAVSATAQKAMGSGDEQLEALLGDDAWHDVILCATGPGGLSLPTPPRLDALAALLCL